MSGQLTFGRSAFEEFKFNYQNQLAEEAQERAQPHQGLQIAPVHNVVLPRRARPIGQRQAGVFAIPPLPASFNRGGPARNPYAFPQAINAPLNLPINFDIDEEALDLDLDIALAQQG